MSPTPPSAASAPSDPGRGAAADPDPDPDLREDDALRGAVERLGDRLETTRDALDRLAAELRAGPRASDASSPPSRDDED